MNETSLGQFISLVFLPFVPFLSGALVALICVILFILFFKGLLPEEKSDAPAGTQHQGQSEQ
jgi:hypothetical protein